MKEPYFRHSIRQMVLLQTALDWHGTPFRPHGNVMGAGVDCVHLAAALYRECGLIKDFTPPQYTMDQGSHARTSSLREYIISTGVFEEVKVVHSLVDTAVIGDLLEIKLGRVSHHVGVMLRSPDFLHVYQHQDVMVSDLRDPTWARRIVGIYRPIE